MKNSLVITFLDSNICTNEHPFERWLIGLVADWAHSYTALSKKLANSSRRNSACGGRHGRMVLDIYLPALGALRIVPLTCAFVCAGAKLTCTGSYA
jgi:hypothetical protein